MFAFWTLQPVTTTRTEAVTSLDPVRVLIENAALASQAVGPPNNGVEMSLDGRIFRELARKMFSLRPLAQQDVHISDSVLGTIDHVARSYSGF